MGRNKKYSGYKSFQYLEPGVDFKYFEPPKEIDRVPPYIIQLSKSEEERVSQLVEKNIFISMHDHPFCWPPLDTTQSFNYRFQCRLFHAYEGLSVSGLDAVFDYMLDGSLATSKSGWKWEDVIYDLGMRLTDIAHQNFAIHCKTVEDINYAFKTGKIAHIFCTKAAPIENEIDRIDILHGLGIRVLGVTYSQSNMLGTGENDNDLGGGLTDFGYDCVLRMNKIGMLIDIGHCADQTCLDVIESSKKPVTASHNVPAAIARGHTNPDEVLLALAEKDGVMGINGGGGGGRSLGTKKNPAGGLEGNMECMEYCIKLMGIDHVGFGIDSMYGDHRKAGGSILPNGHYNRPSKDKNAPWRSPLRAPKFPGWDDPAIDPGYSKGLENPSDNINQIKWLVKHGYSDQEIIKLMGGNALRLLKAVW